MHFVTLFRVLAVLTFFVCVCSISYHGKRKGRWFGYTHTETVVQTQLITSLLPSSCVHVEATLPPCRNVRNMHQFPQFIGPRLYSENVNFQSPFQAPALDTFDFDMNPNENRSVSWAEYLGLATPTVTVTAIKLRTITALDPRTVVTFSVKGCRPARLPMDLSRCPISTPSSLFIEEVFPTPTFSVGLQATSTVSQLNGYQESIQSGNGIELSPSTEETLIDSSHNLATERMWEGDY